MARKSRKESVQTPAVKNGMKVWNAALYIRLSVEFNGQRGDSLETQKKIMESFAALHPDIQVSGIYTDNGITGRTFERAAFQQMLADIEDGKINCIIVKDLSRLGRSTIDTGYYIEKYFPVRQVRFIAVNDQYDSEANQNNGEHIILPFKNMVNEAYAADISRKVRSQTRQSMKSGNYIGARPPYGYRKDPENCHKLIVNEETAPAVRDIFQWAADGVSLNRIATQLNEQGIITPGFYLVKCGLIKPGRLMGSGNWQTWTVTKILADEVYVGDMVQGKTKTIGHKQVPTGPEEWIIVRDTHEPLISRELFEKVQELRRRAAAKSKDQVNIPYTENVLRGRIFCGHCGKNLHRKRSHGEYFFHCISNGRIAKNYCPGVCLKETDLFNIILAYIMKEAETVIGNDLRLKEQDPRIAERKASAEKERKRLLASVEQNRSFLRSLYENLVTGILTSGEYVELKQDYESRITADIAQAQTLEEYQKELDKQLHQFSSLAQKLTGINGSTELTARLVDELIEKIIVRDQQDIEIVFRFKSGFEQVKEVLAYE
jgi:DNA invertase Pin-like site-specific DNA recombinase